MPSVSFRVYNGRRKEAEQKAHEYRIDAGGWSELAANPFIVVALVAAAELIEFHADGVVGAAQRRIDRLL